MNPAEERNQNGVHGRVYEPLFTESDSEASHRGMFGELARRVCRRFNVKVVKDFRMTEKMVATVGSEYCLQTGKTDVIANIDYAFDEKSMLRVGNKSTKLKLKKTFSFLGKQIEVAPSFYMRYDDQVSAGVNLKLANFRTVALIGGIIGGSIIDRSVVIPLSGQSEETSGVDLKLKFRGRRQGCGADGVLRKVATVIHLGPSLTPSPSSALPVPPPTPPNIEGVPFEPIEPLDDDEGEVTEETTEDDCETSEE